MLNLEPEKHPSETSENELEKSGSAGPAGSRKKPVLFIAISIVFTVLLTVFTILYLLFWYVPYDAAEMARIKEKAAAKWDTANAIPAQDNGWFQYEQAINLYRNSLTGNDWDLFSDVVDKGVKPKDFAFIESLKKKNKATLSMADEGYKKTEFQIPVDYSKGYISLRVPNFLRLRSLSQFLVILGDYEKQKKNYEEAAHRYLQVLHIGQGASRDVDVTQFFVGNTLQQYALEHLNDVINETDEEASFYKKILIEMEHIDRKRTTMTEALEFETALGEFTVDEISKTGGRSTFLDGYSAAPVVFRDDIYIRDQRDFDRYALECLKASGGSYTDTFKSIKKLAKPRNYSHVYNCFQNDNSRVPIVAYRTLAKYEGVKILAALKWYRKEKGKYPDSLSELAPAYLTILPKDPFTANSDYKYEKSGDAILLYSIGPDFKDDHGKIDSNEFMDPGDIIFARLESSPAPVKTKKAITAQKLEILPAITLQDNHGTVQNIHPL